MPRRLWLIAALILVVITSAIMIGSRTLTGAAAWANIFALPVAIIAVLVTLLQAGKRSAAEQDAGQASDHRPPTGSAPVAGQPGSSARPSPENSAARDSAGPSATGAPGPVPAALRPGLFDVVLTSVKRNDRNQVVKMVRDVTGLTGMEATRFTRHLPVTLSRGLDSDTTAKLLDLLNDQGYEAHEIPSSLDADEQRRTDDAQLYDVVLHHVDRKRVASLQLVTSAGRFDTAVATEILNNLPQAIQLNVDRATAEQTVADFHSIGARAQIVGARKWAGGTIIRPWQPR